jgi:phosphatidylglycerophosphate synthase
MVHNGVTFTGVAVNLDEGQFVACRFEHCHLVFSASRSVSISGCRFVSCSWGFDGAAALTIDYIAAFYKSGATDFVDGVFARIKGVAPHLNS